MRHQGRIASWNEARGFGFITPEQNGAEQAINGARSAGLFVHVTALQSDGRVPEPGERVTYLIGSGQDGKPRALQVFFPDRPLTLADAVPSAATSATRSAAPSAAPSFRAASQPPRPTSTRERSNPYRRRKSSWSGKLIPLLVLVGLFSIYSRFSAESMAPLPVSSFNQEEVSTPQATTFIRQCDGRQHCSQMTSCEEATWFLQNCPGTKMDGEGDGIPCENQWCGH
ncbi:excalibur calcium-binding domain-containing protein [Aeromonas veronii]|uniref:excalibur calcium-binding domain-containing protein n=1 Tax=Aeromonas veronii TaxID=654 RepID=UPI0007187A4B|nr:excalibur calcium-binding domain-containing protein [Aeromonas veronii]KRV88128.1 DNA-binding protein [Aeromonas veronii]KRV98220.1 DNA-binding protein [Aeromonas veronii]KRW09151.1 DNA-binding protein [Aeromonas veronii]KRW09640.1 DNA-binding protein [Aeromonas veronii]KRW18949.1 DNA-binding protein [Aeromonas veronii]